MRSLNHVLRQSPDTLILASASPRRRELLAELGIPFTVCVSDVSEEADPNLPPAQVAIAIANRKARAVAERNPGALVLAADTIVVVDGEILGKPADENDACRMLRRLAGRRHEVFTGVVLLDAVTGHFLRKLVTSTVHLKPLDDAEINAYVGTGEPLDKAGAYGIQGLGGELVERYEGCFNNIVGLPLCAVAALLSAAGAEIPKRLPGCRHGEDVTEAP